MDFYVMFEGQHDLYVTVQWVCALYLEDVLMDERRTLDKISHCGITNDLHFMIQWLPYFVKSIWRMWAVLDDDSAWYDLSHNR